MKPSERDDLLSQSRDDIIEIKAVLLGVKNDE